MCVWYVCAHVCLVHIVCMYSVCVHVWYSVVCMCSVHMCVAHVYNMYVLCGRGCVYSMCVFGVSCTIYSYYSEQPPTLLHLCWIFRSFKNLPRWINKNICEKPFLFQYLLRCRQKAGITRLVENQGRGMQWEIQFIFGRQIPIPKPERAREGRGWVVSCQLLKVCMYVCVSLSLSSVPQLHVNLHFRLQF